MAVLKSRQNVTVTLGSTVGLANATLSPTVDATKAIIIPNGLRTTTTSSTNLWPNTGRWQFDSNNGTATLAMFFRDPASTPTVVAKATVLEFTSDVNYITQGVITITAGTTFNTATVAPTGSNPFAYLLGVETTGGGGTGGYTDVSASVELTGTTVNARIGHTSTVDYNVGFTIVDLSSRIVNSAQKVQTTLASAATSNTSGTFTPISTANALVFLGGVTYASSSTGGNYSYFTQLTNNNQLTYTRIGVATGSRTLYHTVVEFNGTALDGSVQRGLITGTGAALGNTYTLSTSVNIANSSINLVGQIQSGQPNFTLDHLDFSNSTTIQANATSTWTTLSNTSWEIITFGNFPANNAILGYSFSYILG